MSCEKSCRFRRKQLPQAQVSGIEANIVPPNGLKRWQFLTVFNDCRMKMIRFKFIKRSHRFSMRSKRPALIGCLNWTFYGFCCKMLTYVKNIQGPFRQEREKEWKFQIYFKCVYPTYTHTHPPENALLYI